MTRAQGTLTWGLALIVGALVLHWQQSIPWALTATGAVAVIGAIAAMLIAGDAAHEVEAAKVRDAEAAARSDVFSDLRARRPPT